MPRPAWAPDLGVARASGAAHLDSKEDTGFSAEPLRSQGFRLASVGSWHGRSASGLGARPWPRAPQHPRQTAPPRLPWPRPPLQAWHLHLPNSGREPLLPLLG